MLLFKRELELPLPLHWNKPLWLNLIKLLIFAVIEKL